ncbi:MAG: DegT/DnrJ/EryC1/StrS family aminotransferase [Magnetococcales bacterium]|nr:DegT/DnrJ/EryC1/StrS family aminotransferase [Magnetococcales bacterium]
MNRPRTISIPLARPDLTLEDLESLTALDAPWREDPALISRWEAIWSRTWGRPALAFRNLHCALQCLAKAQRWSIDTTIWTTPLLPHHWHEALDGTGLTRRMVAINPETGHTLPTMNHRDPYAITTVHHHAGAPHPKPDHPTRFILESIDDTPIPSPKCGWGTVQIAAPQGDHIITGGGCVVLSMDHTLIDHMRDHRAHTPCSAVCTLGITQMGRIRKTLQARLERAEQYMRMRPHGYFKMPQKSVQGRSWGGFTLYLPNQMMRDALRRFLQEAGIGADGPAWSTHTPSHQKIEIPGLQSYLERTLVLPLYASLTSGDQKRIINRIHRWAERTKKASQQPSRPAGEATS